MSVNGTLVADKMLRIKGECAHFSFNKCFIYTHDGASAKFSTNSHEADKVGEHKKAGFYMRSKTAARGRLLSEAKSKLQAPRYEGLSGDTSQASKYASGQQKEEGFYRYEGHACIKRQAFII